MNFLLKPHVNLATLVLRIALATIFIYHGYTSLLFGELAQWMSELTPLTIQIIAWSEIVGGAALFLGFLTRLAAFGLAVIQVGAIVMVTGEDFTGFRFSVRGEEGTSMIPGYEFNLALIAMCLAVILLGSGRLSLNYLFMGRRDATNG